MKVIEVKQPVFILNKKNPLEVLNINAPGDLTIHPSRYRMVIVETYAHGFPELKENQILYKLKGYSNRGFILTTEDIYK